MTEKATEKKDDDSPTLSADETAVLQLVTIAPAPRTTAELAASYAGQREANLWPEQSERSVSDNIAALVKRKVLKHGEKAPDDQPTIELA